MTGEPVLFGADGSRHSLAAADWAAREAVLRQVSLRIVSVPFAWSGNTLIGTFGFAVSPQVAKADRAAAASAVNAAAGRAARMYPDLRIDAEIRPGSAARILLRCATEASMLVVGSHGAGGFAAMMLGSVSRCIATSSPCVCVVVTGETHPEGQPVVVGVREPERASAALDFAFDEAARLRAGLHVVHAFGAPWLAAGARHGRDNADDGYADRMRLVLAPWTGKYPDVDVRTSILPGHPGRVLSAASATAGLVVLGRHGSLEGYAPPLSSALHGLLEHAQGPVAVIPDSR